MKHKLLGLLLELSALLSLLSAGAQDCNRDSLDFAFAVRQIEENYAGYPSAVTASNRTEYEALKERLRSEVLAGRSGCEAVGELFGWFGDFHLQAGIYTAPYQRRRADYGAVAYAPGRLACKVDEGTYLIRIPSFEYDPSLMAWIASAAESYRKSGCEYLIVDIRGNGGGRDQAYQPLLALLYDRPAGADRVEIRVSADNEQFLRRAVRENDGLDWLLPVADSMAAGVRDFVPFPGGAEAIEFDSVSPLPRRAVVMIDGNVASSGEQFVLDVRACSDRTEIYGRDNTLGCLDFRTSDVPICPAAAFRAGSP